jgi:hypothetical protein
MEEIDESIEETLVEMAYRWGDIEEALPAWYRPAKGEFEDDERVGSELAAALGEAFRVEAACESGLTDFGEPWARFRYEALFDVERREAREGAHTVRTNLRFLENVIKKLSGGQARDVSVRVVSPGTAAEGQVCGRPFEPPPKPHLDVADVPDEKPDSNVPLERIDGYWLTPIEVPFYKALRETGLVLPCNLGSREWRVVFVWTSWSSTTAAWWRSNSTATRATSRRSSAYGMRGGTAGSRRGRSGLCDGPAARFTRVHRSAYASYWKSCVVVRPGYEVG